MSREEKLKVPRTAFARSEIRATRFSELARCRAYENDRRSLAVPSAIVRGTFDTSFESTQIFSTHDKCTRNVRVERSCPMLQGHILQRCGGA